jgi:charged multivesicular body protein 2A
MASMNRGLNLPSIQRIMNDFEKESSMMDMKEEMMSEAVDDVMDEEDEEEEGDKILKQVLDEIGVDLSQQVRHLHASLLLLLIRYQLTEAPTGIATTTSLLVNKQPVALGESTSTPHSTRLGDSTGGDSLNSGALSDEDALQARLDALRRS